MEKEPGIVYGTIRAGQITHGLITSPNFTPSAGVRLVNSNLADLGFVPRDADGNDYANPDHLGLRFKTGCSMGEVTTQVVMGKQHLVPIRATSWSGIDHMLLAIRKFVDEAGS